MEIDLRHEKTPELTGIDLRIDKVDISMLKSGIPLGRTVKELNVDIEVNLKKQDNGKDVDGD